MNNEKIKQIAGVIFLAAAPICYFVGLHDVGVALNSIGTVLLGGGPNSAFNMSGKESGSGESHER